MNIVPMKRNAFKMYYNIDENIYLKMNYLL